MSFLKERKYVGLLFIYLIFFFAAQAFGMDTAEKVDVLPEAPSYYFTATYFHTTSRCPTCRQIETLSKEAIAISFADELQNGILLWRAVNVDESENRHYTSDYQLFTKSLIISEIKDGKEVRWKNLEKIWVLVRDKNAFSRYVTSEIKAWMVAK